VITDLSQLTGFPLRFDSETLEVATEVVQFNREPRLLEEMSAVLQDSHPSAANSVLYWNFKQVYAGEFNDSFLKRHLTFGLVLLPSGKVGREYIKTHGHYHSTIPGSRIGFPEVYTHFYGTLYLLLQRRRDPEEDHLDDCVLISMIPGQSIMIPPGYAHILVNPSTAPGLMAGLYSMDSAHNYAPIKRMAGAAYYVSNLNGQICFEPNPAYTNPPPLRTLTSLDGTPFEPPDQQMPLWQSFINDPDRYAFIYNPNLTKSRFAPEDLRS